ncbi:putative HC-toxin efflux carrier TOXA [Venturia nashicola]|nr:putative HC-toxin efflux carrier TOXA [Venturia nashicola]
MLDSQPPESERLLGLNESPEQFSDIEWKRHDSREGGIEEDDESRYPPFRSVVASVDRTIIGVAIPAISNDFKSFGDIAWYEAAFLLTLSVAQLPMGKIYTFYPAKWTFFVLVVIFEIGSILCAAAPSSTALIIGRAITGFGGAGNLAGASIIMTGLVPLRKRPKYQGFAGAVFGIASIVGPLVGGVLTTKATWRWCFWLNLCIGVPALAGILLFLPVSPPPEKRKGTFTERLWKFDPVGNMLLAPGLICVLLALEWGGTRYPWNDFGVLVLLAVGSVLFVAFAASQYFQENGTLPPRILQQRTIAAGVFVSIGFGAALIIPTFYLPIWFQAIKGTTAVDASVKLLPLFLSTCLFVIGTGFGMAKTGYYTPWLIVGCAIRMVGVGLMATLRVDAGTMEWIGYQIIVGLGTGMTLSPVNIAVQTVLPKRDIPTGLTVMMFTQFLAGTISVSICQAVLANTLIEELPSKLPGFDVSSIATAGATKIRELVSPSDLPVVLEVYNKGVVSTFFVALTFSSLALVASLFMEWNSVKGSRPPSALDEQMELVAK